MAPIIRTVLLLVVATVAQGEDEMSLLQTNAGLVETAGCKNFCAKKTKEWAIKCNWGSCNTCQECVTTGTTTTSTTTTAGPAVGSTTKVTYPDVNCPAGYEAATSDECQGMAGQDGYVFQGTLNGDGNWIDGCFEWYANRGGMNENTKRLYFNNRAGATTGNFGGNRMCIVRAPTTTTTTAAPEPGSFLKVTYPDVNCPNGYNAANAGQCQALAGQDGYAFQSTLNGDGNWIEGCFEWYANRGGMNENTKRLYFNNRAGATTGNFGGNRMCIAR